MTRFPRAVAACLAAASAAIVTSASAWAQQPDRPSERRPEEVRAEDTRAEPGDQPPPLPSVAIQGWRLGGSLYGGYDTNALDVVNGDASRELDLGADGSAGTKGRFATLEAKFDVGRRQYADVDGRSGWRGAAGATAGRRLSRMSVGSLNFGYRYDFTDGFTLPDLATQLPRSTVRGLFGEARYVWKPWRRYLWTNQVRYETLDFAEDTLTDTKTLRARTEFERQVSRLDRIGPRYEFLRTEWAPRSSDIHSFLGGWRRGADRERWGFDVEAGATRGTVPLATGTEVGWRFSGTGIATLKTTRTAFSLTLRRGVTPGYGQGRLLDTSGVQASAQYFITRSVWARFGAAIERSTDKFDPVYGTQTGAYLDGQLATRLATRLGIVASYRYRYRDSFGSQVSSNRFGLTLTSEIQSSRVRTGAGLQGPR
jgi:hypothetical protein